MLTIKSIKEIYPNAAGHKGGGASKEAAERINPKRGILHERVKDALRLAETPLTAEEVARLGGMSIPTAKARLSELKNDGEVLKLDERGVTELGGSCHKWALNTCNLTENNYNQQSKGA
jgi:hypothetical protein